MIRITQPPAPGTPSPLYVDAGVGVTSAHDLLTQYADYWRNYLSNANGTNQTDSIVVGSTRTAIVSTRPPLPPPDEPRGSLAFQNWQATPQVPQPYETVVLPAFWTTPSTAPGSLPPGGDFSNICWNGTVFVVLADNAAAAATSPDGITWILRILPVIDYWYGLAWNGTVFCAVSYGSGQSITSPDGITWTAHAGPGNYSFMGIAWNGSVFCIGVNNDTRYLSATSPDGINWTRHAGDGFAFHFSLMTWGAGYFCAVSGLAKNTVMVSLDGISWTTQTLPATKNWSSIAHYGNCFLAIASDGTVAASRYYQISISWNPVAEATSYNLYWSLSNTVTPQNGIKISGVTSTYVHTGRTIGTAYYYLITAVNASGESAVSGQIVSVGEPMWLAGPTIPGIPAVWHAVGTMIGFSAVSSDGRSAFSADGYTWQVRDLPGLVPNLWAITFGGGVFCAVGGAVHANRSTVSSDGLHYGYEVSAITQADVDAFNATLSPGDPRVRLANSMDPLDLLNNLALPLGYPPQAPIGGGWTGNSVYYNDPFDYAIIHDGTGRVFDRLRLQWTELETTACRIAFVDTNGLIAAALSKATHQAIMVVGHNPASIAFYSIANDTRPSVIIVHSGQYFNFRTGGYDSNAATDTWFAPLLYGWQAYNIIFFASMLNNFPLGDVDNWQAYTAQHEDYVNLKPVAAEPFSFLCFGGVTLTTAPPTSATVGTAGSIETTTPPLSFTLRASVPEFASGHAVATGAGTSLAHLGLPFRQGGDASATVGAAPAPTGVSTSGGSLQTSTAWNPVVGANAYNLYFSTLPGVTKQATKISGASSPYVHTGRAAATPYYYAVAAVNINGEGPLSTETTATTDAIPIPAIPSGVGTVGGTLQETITWGAVSGATSYNIYWGTAPGITLSSTKITGATSPYVHTGRVAGTVYYYKVTAVNTFGESSLSAEVSATTDAAPSGPAPTIRTISYPSGSGGLMVVWAKVPTATSYNVYWSSAPTFVIGGGGVTKITAPTTTEYLEADDGSGYTGYARYMTITGLAPATLYYVAVTVVDATGESVLSNILSGTTG